ncbi:hypothetical protein FRB90_002462 [Tulasnella sp. 427]|nr:hypothetical protein FRB90_002462 [Tulasnella sp. 427]
MTDTKPQALCIPEILSEIFDHLPNRADAASAATVCRTWTSIALNRVWQDLPSVFPLLELLGPLMYVDSRGWDFERGIPDVDFGRLSAYTSRIRSLRYSDQERWTGGYRQRISTDVSAKILYYVASHNGGHLLPSVRSIEWAVSKDEAVHQILPFFSTTLVGLDIKLGCDVTGRTTLDMLRTLSNVLPKDLKHFRFLPSMENETIDTELTSTLHRFQSLSILQTPYSALSADTLVRIGSSLQSLEVQYLLEDTEELEDLSVLFMETCPIIENIVLYVAWATQQEWEDHEHEHVPFRLLRPLLRCSNLIELQIDFVIPIHLEINDVRAIQQAWPELQVLHLSAKSFNPEFPGMPLSILSIFSAYWPAALRRLALFCSCDDVPATSTDQKYPLRDLEALGFGSALIDRSNIEPVIAYLQTLFRIRKLVANPLPWWGPESSPFEPFGEIMVDNPWRDVIDGVEVRSRKISGSQVLVASAPATGPEES